MNHNERFVNKPMLRKISYILFLLIKGKRRKILPIILLMTFTFYYIVLLRIDNETNNIFIPKSDFTNKWIIDTPGCQIPVLDPMHPTVAFLFHPMKPLNCTTTRPVLIFPGNNPNTPSLHFDIEAVEKFGVNITCFYISLLRKDDQETIEGNVKPLKANILNVTDEFIKVECLDKYQNSVYLDIFPFIQRKENVEERYQHSVHNQQARKSSRLSVLLLGMDSMSKNQYLRHMKKTDSYLRKKITFVELHGYNKIGKNTFPNIIGMMTGRLETEVIDTSKTYANTLPLIWDEFTKLGYKTLYSEDMPNISIFHYARMGFAEQPTDYYLRPFSLMAESSLVNSSETGCFNHRLEADVILNWTGDFFDVFPDDPLFAFTFLTRLSHDYINEPSLQDEPFQRFLQRLYESGHLNRTIVFFFGDHGFRFGQLRSTYVGRLEGKLPFMFTLIPPWLPSKFPNLFANLKVNSKRLTSPFDIYATLQGILNFTELTNSNELPKHSRGMNLFKHVISENRTCEDISIPVQFCSCLRMESINTSEMYAVVAAEKLVDKINEITKDVRDKCSELKLDKIENAQVELHMGESISENASRFYQVTISVQPSQGLFEGTVWHLVDGDKYVVQPGIERVNLYGDQSSCINTTSLKPFCFCSNE